MYSLGIYLYALLVRLVAAFGHRKGARYGAWTARHLAHPP